MRLISGGGVNDLIKFSNSYFKPMKLFDIQSVNRRITKPLVIDVGDELVAPRKFLSENRHSNTIVDDLSEIFQINIE